MTQLSAAQSALIASLNDLPSDWALTLAHDNQLLCKPWHPDKPFSPKLLVFLLSLPSYYWNRLAVRTGEISGGLLEVRLNHWYAIDLWQSLNREFGQHISTLSWTNGEAGCKQLVFQIPPSQQPYFKRVKKLFLQDRDLNPNTPRFEGTVIEFRYNDSLSILPPNLYSKGGQYRWIVPPTQGAVAEAPAWLIQSIRAVLKRGGQQRRLDLDSYVREIDRAGCPDIRSFMHWLEGYNPKEQEGWASFQCPLEEGDLEKWVEVSLATGEMRVPQEGSAEAVYWCAFEQALDRGFEPDAVQLEEAGISA